MTLVGNVNVYALEFTDTLNTLQVNLSSHPERKDYEFAREAFSIISHSQSVGVKQTTLIGSQIRLKM